MVAYSGGLDSSVLLHLLAQHTDLRERGLRALHVHHGLHGDADTWAAHCRETCAVLGVPLQVVQVVVEDDGSGPEAAARSARHGAFANALGDNEVLALAHHRDDQAETFLLRALRASGVDGLAAMRPWRRYHAGWLWRPLLRLSRAELLAYAHEYQLRWIDDPSNAHDAFDRNFLRHKVMPLLRERWPNADAAFARSAGLAAEASQLLGEGDADALEAVRGDDPALLDVACLCALASARRARVLRRWIDDLGLPSLPAQGVATVESTLLQVRADAEACFAWEGTVIRRWRGVLHAGLVQAPLPADYQTTWDGAAPLRLPTGDTLVLAPAVGEKRGFDNVLTVHARHGGERIELPGRAHSHSLKHVLQDLGVPPWSRERLPLLSDADGTLLAAGDLMYSASFDAWLHERGLRLVWERSWAD